MTAIIDVEKVGRDYRLDGSCPECDAPIFPALVRTPAGFDVAWHCDACLAGEVMTEKGLSQ